MPTFALRNIAHGGRFKADLFENLSRSALYSSSAFEFLPLPQT
jgi:hypothetical protein